MGRGQGDTGAYRGTISSPPPRLGLLVSTSGWWEARLEPRETPVSGNAGSSCRQWDPVLAGDSLRGHVATAPSSSSGPRDHSACDRLGFHPHKACFTPARRLEGRRRDDRLETGGRETTAVPENSKTARAPRSRKTALRSGRGPGVSAELGEGRPTGRGVGRVGATRSEPQQQLVNRTD